MIFIGAELSDPHAHFVTNIIASIGTEEDLIIDLLNINDSEMIFAMITSHLHNQDEQFVIYNAYTDEDFFITFKEQFPKLRLITVFSDDEWRHKNYDRYLALYSDIFTIAVKNNLQSYKDYGLSPFYMKWACNPDMFYPLPEQNKDIDVSFIGAAYGQRILYIRFLIKSGIKVSVFGRGWDRYADIRPYWGGYLIHKEMIMVIARSKINLNFLWTSAEKERCTIKGRTLELAASQAFQLSNDTDEFINYGFINGENIALFEQQQSMVDKIRYYLQHSNERKVIALHAYEHVLKHHTWKQRFHEVFEYLENNERAFTPIHQKSKILVIVKRGIQHQINTKDDKLNISIIDSASDWKKKVAAMDGVIYLDYDSTLDNVGLYMMVFGLLADKSDMVVANFYVGSVNKPYWIRVIDRIVEQKRSLLSMIPLACQMFSGPHLAKHGMGGALKLSQMRISYIEYPSFWIKLPYLKARKLRLYFACHGDARNKLKEYFQKNNFGLALSLIFDKIWQNRLQRKLKY